MNVITDYHIYYFHSISTAVRSAASVFDFAVLKYNLSYRIDLSIELWYADNLSERLKADWGRGRLYLGYSALHTNCFSK